MTAEAAFGIPFRLTVTDEEDVRGVRYKGHCYFNCSFDLSRDGISLQLLRLVMRDERIDEGIEVAFHHEIELVNR